MGPARPQQKLDFSTLPTLLPKENLSRPGSTASSPIEPPSERQSRFAGAFGGMTSSTAIRPGAGSPSHELGGRLYSTRRYVFSIQREPTGPLLTRAPLERENSSRMTVTAGGPLWLVDFQRLSVKSYRNHLAMTRFPTLSHPTKNYVLYHAVRV